MKRGLDHKNDDFDVNLALANNKERREKEKRVRNLIIFGLNRVESQKDDEKQALSINFGVKKINSWQLKIKKVAVKMLDLAVSKVY